MVFIHPRFSSLWFWASPLVGGYLRRDDLCGCSLSQKESVRSHPFPCNNQFLAWCICCFNPSMVFLVNSVVKKIKTSRRIWSIYCEPSPTFRIEYIFYLSKVSNPLQNLFISNDLQGFDSPKNLGYYKGIAIQRVVRSIYILIWQMKDWISAPALYRFVELSSLVELALDTREPLTDAALHFVSRLVLFHT